MDREFEAADRVPQSPAGAERVETVIVGGGQAGLSVGYHLARRDRQFLILDAKERIGDAWRNRWDSLRLFTPAWLDGLAGMPFPAPRHTFPTKDEMADYLASYAAHFELPVRPGVRVDSLSRNGERFLVSAGDQRIEADNVEVAMSSYQRPKVSPFAAELDPCVVQMHSIDYRRPSQLREGGVLVVGAGNSGAEIALDVAADHPTWLSGRDTGHLPFPVDGAAARIVLLRLLLRGVFHHVMKVNTRLGRKVYRKTTTHGMPLIRVRPAQFAAAGVERVSRVTGVRDGLPVIDADRVLDVANVIWCTGFHADFSWLDLPVLGDRGEPIHRRGIVTAEPRLSCIGLHFLHSASSGMIHGLDRDARYIVDAIASGRSTVRPRVVANTAVDPS